MKLHLPVFRRRAGFTVVEVMMASLILMVGFIGLIEAVIITSTTMDHARRQMLANQIINHEIEELYLSNWSTISNLTTTTTTIAIDRMFWPVWLPGNSYAIDRGVTYQGNYYRCIASNTGKPLSDTAYWTTVTTSLTSDIVFSHGATFTLTRNVIDVDPVTNIREINFVVTWVVTSSRLASGGTRLTTTHTCANSAWYGKNGLQLSYRKS